MNLTEVLKVLKWVGAGSGLSLPWVVLIIILINPERFFQWFC